MCVNIKSLQASSIKRMIAFKDLKKEKNREILSLLKDKFVVHILTKIKQPFLAISICYLAA